MTMVGTKQGSCPYSGVRIYHRRRCHAKILTRFGHRVSREARFAPKPERRSATTSAAADHLFRTNPGVELLGRQEAELDRRLAQRLSGLVRGLGDLGGIVVAD